MLKTSHILSNWWNIQQSTSTSSFILPFYWIL